jgi:hypothetical protein
VSPSVHGTTVTLRATATGCSSPVFQFSVAAPGSTGYTVVQPYSATATYTWVTTGAAAGQYQVSVWVRDAASAGAAGNTAGRWDAYNNSLAYRLM